MAQEVAQQADAPEWLRAAAKDWHLQATSAMSGGVSAKLDEHLPTPERVALVLTLAERALIGLRERGEVLPAAWLNSLGLGKPGTTFQRDLPAEKFTRAGEDFIWLLRGVRGYQFNRGTLLTPLAVAVGLIGYVLWQGDWLGLVGLPLIYLGWCGSAPNMNLADGCLPVLATGLTLALGTAMASNGILIASLASGTTWLVASLEAGWRSKRVPFKLAGDQDHGIRP